MKTVEMPKMGDTMEEGKILNWFKQEGDTIKKGEPIAEVETDKVNIEIESFVSGVLRKIIVPAGSAAPIGAPIAYVGSADEPLPAEATGTAQANGTHQATGNGTAPAVQAQLATQAAPATTVSRSTEPERGRIFISPIARRLAEEHRLDYKQLRGSGPNGRIIKMDVEAAIAAQQQTAPSLQPAVSLPLFETYVEPRSEEPLAPVLTGQEADEFVEIPLTAMRRTIARRLSQSMQTAPHFYVTSVIDTGKLGQLRKQINEYAAKDPSPLKISYNDLIVKAVALTLRRMPQMNVSFAEDRLLQKKHVHVGVAVALEQGLIVPVVRNADKYTVLELARETQRLASLARGGKLRPEDFSGGTFTVSNLGMFDVDSFTAVINPPESAILAVGSITPTPVVVEGEIVVRERMKVTLSSDHRAIDGATAARFLQEVKRLLEEPFGLLL
ncbi:2-oxo acid dehydrogenase subunit E2 [Ktedonosporobacter rubrisoli]|uniref:Dihydrolipoamide acetyltransferase component of pyruvate dehydrogenase complex n=1 Tax=Ktedonosporobacter rubrisoli TaxID=2509675 RepID=A0A4P6K161_KTERU|nr:dihydrolipoamide acetyltransferase family protein [Ktedonosporobacter rubrisoli]QBD81166.1 2-oxo acid dehydrogenase subunit E2 [Ktedonosporobacter rubrisoli]